MVGYTGSVMGEWSFTYDKDGNQVTEISGAGAWKHTNVYADGELLATYDPNGVHFAFGDWQGTKRAQASATGTLEVTCDNLPFNDGFACQGPGGSDATEHHYTGKEHDPYTGLDLFGARNFTNYSGRFLSPDPLGPWVADASDPQSWNMYAYARNNPLTNTDPTGYDCVYLNDAGTGIDKGGVDTNSNSGECGNNGGYWVDGGLTNINVNADQGSVQLTGTTNGTDQTHASYQDTSVFVGMYQNSSVNPFGHIAIGITGQTPVGLNPASDLNFLIYATYGGKGGGVSGVVKPQGPKGLKKFVRVPVTGMQAKMIQDQLNRAMGNAPNYDIFGGGGPACDCAGFAQQMLGDAGINSGPPTDIPSTLMQQLGSQYPQQ